MDENVMRVLQMLQDGKISAQEAETLIAALRGEKAAPEQKKEPEQDEADKNGFFFGFDTSKVKGIDLDDLGERISRAVAKVQPEKILRRVQTQIRTASRSGASWSASVTARVRTWTDGEDVRPTRPADSIEQIDEHVQETHLDGGALVMVENPLGDVIVTAGDSDTAVITAKKHVWGQNAELLKENVDQVEIAVHGTDSRLDIKVSAPDLYRAGTVDLELRVPASVQARVSTRFGRCEIRGVEGRAEAVSTAGEVILQELGADARCESASGKISVSTVAGAATIASQSGDIEVRGVLRGLSANSASGDVTAEDIEGGRVECKSVSGDVRASRLGLENPLDITVESISGAVNVTEASGNIGLKAVSGDVEAEQLVATRLQAQTVSGDVKVGMKEAFHGAMQLNTVSGDVTLKLPEGTNARVSLASTSGELHCEHEASDVTSCETLWTGQIGTGAGTINVQTISGDVRIQRA
ncbi:MAG TPA: DUF4097 family beta strand repeat-containing protein [Chthonomonadaceae bacterium]|nr:DUF4097 family beta strand repeat-containing protein [Chthonomonadaceae bacterium]